MIENGLIKALTPVNHIASIKMIGLEDQRKCLASIKLKENKRDILLLCKA